MGKSHSTVGLGEWPDGRMADGWTVADGRTGDWPKNSFGLGEWTSEYPFA